MSLAAQIVIALVLLVAGFGGGVKYHAGIIAQRDLAAREARESDERQQRARIDRAATAHEGDKAQIRTEFLTITQEVERVVQQPIYRDRDPVRPDAGLCLDDDGLRLVRAAVGAPAAPGQPAPALPSPQPAR